MSTAALWIGFHVLVLALLALDLGVLGKTSHVVGTREALFRTAVWVTLALLFGAGIAHWSGPARALQFLTGYVVEYSLSVDNIFVFVVIFQHFAVPREHQPRTLFWGILGAIVMRGAMIGAGVGLLRLFHWTAYLFGGFLLLTGARMLLQRGGAPFAPEKSPLVRVASRILRFKSGYHGRAFIVREEGRWAATPLLLVLVVVEVSDLVFAVDSIPAVLAVTRDLFVVYTSNIFAILGLRSLYFLVAGAMRRFRYLGPSLAAILIFVGSKMCAADLVEVHVAVSLGVIVGILAIGVFASWIAGRRTGPGAGDPV